MIEQHYYTRDKSGIFSKTPGYDTVAKSINLDDEFIINTLQDLCFYEAPADLAGEEEISKYPKALFCINTEHNKMVIGESAFAGKDYTGGRNRYFTHNYIISEEEKHIYIKNPERIIYSEGFLHNYDINKGHIIPEIKGIRENKNLRTASFIEEMFNRTSINKEIFINLIKASFHAAEYGKKIYVVLNCDSSSVTDTAKEILKYLYRVIPFAVRRKIGFITYMKSPKNKSLINIIFLCKGSIKRINTEIKAGYVFDIPSNEFYIDGIDNKKSPFIDFVMNNVEKEEILNEFFDKMDNSEFKDSLNLCKYDDIFNLNKDNSRVEKVHEKINEDSCNNSSKQKNNKMQKNKYIVIIKLLINKVKRLLKNN
jgi:hypothetical protein